MAQSMAGEKIWQPTMSGLLDICQIFQIDQDPDALIQQVLPSLAGATGADRASLMLVDDSGQALTIRGAIGLHPGTVATARVAIGEPISGWVAQTGVPLLLPDGPDIPPAAWEVMAREAIASALCVPLRTRQRVIGVLNVARLSGRRPFTLRHLRFASLLAERVAAAFEAVRLYRALETRERFTVSIVESIPSSLVVFDRALRVVSANRNFLDKARKDARVTVGRRIDEVFPRTLMEFTRMADKVREVFRTGQTMEGGKLSYRAPGLPTRIYFYRLVPLKVGAAVENVMVLMDDITEREQIGEEMRRAERHLASVVECANDLVVSMDLDGRITTWNRAAEAVSGFSAGQAKGQALPDLCVREHRQAMADLVRQVARGQKVQNAELHLLTREDHEVPIAWSGSSMHDDQSHVMGIVAVGRDLRERRRLEAQIVQSAKMASLGVMAGGIAHELRNPLGVASAAAQLLLDHPDDERLRVEGLHKIHTGIQRASSIIENLLKFAKPQAEQHEAVHINELLRETLALLAHQMTLRKVDVKAELQRGLPSVWGNKSLLQQVFTNMILNACNAMPQGGILTITTATRDGDGVEIRFTDTGHGIRPEHLSRIFDPFFTTMPVGQGTGLGLSICYGIIQQHGGSIGVESQVGRGATFTIRLPSPAAEKVRSA